MLKLADFGVSQIMESGNDLLNNKFGSRLYHAPEVWNCNTFNGKPADIWACGVVLYMLLT